MQPLRDSNEPVFELLKVDFEGLYEEHIKAVEDFTGNRLRILLAVQAVPLLAIGALLSTSQGMLAEQVTSLQFPVALYFLFTGTAVLGVTVLELWIGGAVHANLFARALNYTRGKYIEALRKVPGFEGWNSWLPITGAKPSLQYSDYLRGLVVAFAFINAFYASLGLVGLFVGHSGNGEKVLFFWLIVFSLSGLGTFLHFYFFRRRVNREQEQALKYLSELERSAIKDVDSTETALGSPISRPE